MREGLAHFFELERYGTTFRRELLAGLTTFVTMSYIIAVNPAILKAAGVPRGASMTATIVTAIFGSTMMGLIANRPFAVAPYMGENAFVAFTVVGMMGYRWETALGAVFIAGIAFTLLTVAQVRKWLAEAIPASLSHSFAAGIGLFLTFVGLNECGLVTIGVPGAPVHIGNFASPAGHIAILSFLLIAALVLWRVPGAILLGVLASSIVAFLLGVAPAPLRWVSRPPRPLTNSASPRYCRCAAPGFFWRDVVAVCNGSNRYDGLAGGSIGTCGLARHAGSAPTN